MNQHFEKASDPQEIINRLKAEGYDNVYEYTAKPNEVDEEHDHPHDTHLVILSGAIVIKLDGTSFALIAGEETDIPRETAHSAQVGSKGCKYIVAEKY